MSHNKDKKSELLTVSEWKGIGITAMPCALSLYADEYNVSFTRIITYIYKIYKIINIADNIADSDSA